MTDIETFGHGGVDTVQGIVVFDETGASSRFAEDIAPIDLNLGLDGLLYALYPGGSPGGRSLNVYNPATLEKIREIDLVASLGWLASLNVALTVWASIILTKSPM